MIREDRLVFPIPPGVHWRDAMPIVLPGAKQEQLALEAPHPRTRRPRTRIDRTRGIVQLNGISFSPPPKPVQEKPKQPPKLKVKNDPKLVAAARELRDRWLERVNSDPLSLASQGKYEVSRVLDVNVSAPIAALPAPIAA